MKKFLAIPGITFLTLFFFAGCEEKIAPKEVIRPVRAMQIGSAEGLNKRSFPGRAAATQEVNLGFEVAGTMVGRLVSKGDTVKKGQLLAQLDPRDFQNALNASVAERDRAKAHRDRIARAAATGAVAKQELTNADARLKVAVADVRIKEKALEDAKLIAPFDGVISATYVENYQRVQAKQQVLRLLDDSRIEFTVNIPESLIAYVQYVTEAFVRFDAFGERDIPATVKEIGTEASETTRTYPVTLIMDQPEDIKIMPGMAGKVHGKTELPDEAEAREKGFDVPVSAVFEEGGKSYVWVIDGKSMTVSKQEVTTGSLSNLGIRVDGNIRAGDWIATAGVHFLKEGQRVRILENGNREVSS